MCRLGFSPFNRFGEAQALNLRRSSLHSKVEPGSSEVNLNRAFALAVRFPGFLVIFVSGGSVSFVAAGGYEQPLLEVKRAVSVAK